MCPGIGRYPEESEYQRPGTTPDCGNAMAVGRGIPCRCRTRHALNLHSRWGAARIRAKLERRASAHERGASDPGEIGRRVPRRQWPGMKPGHHGRPGMKPGRPVRFLPRTLPRLLGFYRALSPVLPNPIREPSPALRTRISVLRTRVCECYTLSTENDPALREKSCTTDHGYKPGACITDSFFDILCKVRDQ